jgi:IS5 family transposase
MAQPIVRVEGARELRATLKRAGAEMKDFTAAHREVSVIVAGAGATRAPRQTGRLASSIRPGGTKTQAIARGGGARVPYANPIHWGWPRRNIRPSLFLTTAAKDTEEQWVEVYHGRLLQIIQKVHGA